MSQPKIDKGITRRQATTLLASACLTELAKTANTTRTTYVVPNFHPASCGWLANFSDERVYCCNSYLDHLDRVRDDSNYRFVLSEVNNVIAIMNFHPERIPELKQRIREGRVELVNAFFLEPTINLSGGEALVRQVVLGSRWYSQVFGVRPRYAWTIDVCGTHDQMAQIAAGLGLDAMVYTRKNPTGKTIHWAESPDGSRILCFSPGHYSELGDLFSTKVPLDAQGLSKIKATIAHKEEITPGDAPVLILAGYGDYALAPAYKGYPSEFLEQWQLFDPSHPVKFATLSDYVDRVTPAIRSGAISLPTMKGGTAYDFDGFWIENPHIKTWFRRDEQLLQAAEFLATGASLLKGAAYPGDDLYHAWILTCLDMDRNSLWGSAGGMVFVSKKSWDVQDRLTWVEKTTSRVVDQATRSFFVHGTGATVFNPLTWQRHDPVHLNLPEGVVLEDASCEAVPQGGVLVQRAWRQAALESVSVREGKPAAPGTIELPERFETEDYVARIDAKTGDLASLRLKPNGREMIGGPANVIWLERPSKAIEDTGDFMPPRPERKVVGSSHGDAKISATEGPICWSIEASGELSGAGILVRRIRLYKNFPRIDFETELNDLPNQTVAFAEFPLTDDVDEIRRGIPYGFSHGAWAKPNPDLHGWTKGITPAVRWSHYSLVSGGGMAIFDRGCTGREINGRVPIIYLYNATDKYYGYPNAWLSGKGQHVLQYAVVFHAEEWKNARIPHMAWEYNVQPILIANRNGTASQPFLTASSNVIVEAVRREEDHVEVRLAECLGLAGTAEIDLFLPHNAVVMTDLTGRNPKPITGKPYRFAVRPQQIVTLHFQTSAALPVPGPVDKWDAFVPVEKLAALHAYSNDKGHPPRGE